MLRVYAIFDSLAGVFSNPFFSHTDGTARRAFYDGCLDSETVFSKHPADYVLYDLGEWDPQLGKLSGHEPLAVCNGVQVIDQVGAALGVPSRS